MSTRQWLEGVSEQLVRIATPERAEREKRYLKSSLQFLGASVPQVRAVSRAFLREHPELSSVELRRLAESAWRTRVHELRSFAIILLQRRVKLMGAEDLPWILSLLREARTWAHVDELAIRVVGPILTSAPRAAPSLLRRWALDPDFWVRRTALLALLLDLRAGGGNFELFAELAEPMLTEREFFIRKAIGWVLREVGRRRPELTFRFLSRNLERASGLSLREGAKSLSAAQRRRLGLNT